MPWIVADFFLRLNLMRTPPSALLGARPHPDEKERIRAYREGMERLRAVENASLTPTFAVILSGDPEIPRKPGLANVPRLRPDSDDPDAIVAEVVATCRSIEGA